jgi:hypothetical protein
MVLGGRDAADRIENLGDSIVFAFAGMFELVGKIVAQGFDSESESAGMLTAIYSGINKQYLVDLGKKTFRGVEDLAERDLHIGGRCLGYRNVQIEDESQLDSHGKPVVCGVRLEVEPKQETIVRLIFAMYAEGRSLKHITKSCLEPVSIIGANDSPQRTLSRARSVG